MGKIYKLILLLLVATGIGPFQPLVAQQLPIPIRLQRDSLKVIQRNGVYNTEKLPSYRAQSPNYEDSIVINSKKNYVRAGTEWLLVQAFPASFNYFIRKDPYSHINFKNFVEHLSPTAWAWDDNAFETNQIAHPYHGQLYFNAFRSNNFTFKESALATLAGSFIWETAGETQAPSINDLVNTTFGGIVVGEMMHRVSNNILSRPSRTYAERQGKEIVAFLVNPVNGINRLLDGRWGRKVKGAVRDSSYITGEFDLGVRRFDTKLDNLLERGKNDFYARIRLLYSNGNQDNKKPFDDFYVNFEVGTDDSSFVNTVNVYAAIYGQRIFKNSPGKHLGVVSANYDFYHNEAFFYGSQSVNYNIMSNFKLGSKNHLTTTVAAGPVILAAVPDPYLLFGQSRNYNYGPGLSLRAQGEVSLFRILKLGASYNGGYFVTMSGNDSHYFLHTFSTNGSLRIFKNLSLNATSGYFNLKGHFKDYPSINSTYPFIRASVGYNVLF